MNSTQLAMDEYYFRLFAKWDLFRKMAWDILQGAFFQKNIYGYCHKNKIFNHGVACFGKKFMLLENNKIHLCNLIS